MNTVSGLASGLTKYAPNDVLSGRSGVIDELDATLIEKYISILILLILFGVFCENTCNVWIHTCCVLHGIVTHKVVYKFKHNNRFYENIHPRNMNFAIAQKEVPFKKEEVGKDPELVLEHFYQILYKKQKLSEDWLKVFFSFSTNFDCFFVFAFSKTRL